MALACGSTFISTTCARTVSFAARAGTRSSFPIARSFSPGRRLPWRLAILLVATAPLDLLYDTSPEPLMTTFIQRYALIGGTGVEERIQIGGWVLRNSDSAPIAHATVQRVRGTGANRVVLEQAE